MPHILNRKQKQAHTRECLMGAAMKVFSRRGLEKGSIDEVAEEAGYTKGAFYANFKSKDELFLAMMDEKFAEEINRLDAALAGGSDLEEATRDASIDFMRFARSDPEWQRVFFEFGSKAARDPEFREEFMTRVRAMRQRTGELFVARAREAGFDPPIPVEDIARMISFMTCGFLFEQQLEDLDDELYGSMTSIFLAGLLATAGQGAAAGTAQS